MVAVPVVEGIEVLVVRTLAALGIGAAAHEATKAIPGTQDRTRDCAEAGNEAQCNQCRLQEGRVGQAAQPRYVTRRNRINYDYQLYIANLHAVPERFFYVRRGDNANEEVNLGWEWTKDMFGSGGEYTTVEWNYMGVWFDGFWRPLCTVVEAKANYEKMFGMDGDSPDRPWADSILQQWKGKDLKRQLAAVVSAEPQGKLEWHFMQLLPYHRALEAGLPATIARYTPMPLKEF